MSKVFKAVGNAVSGVVKAVGSIVTGVVNAVSSVVSGVINFVVSPFLGLFGLGTPSMPEEATPDSLKGVMVQRSGSDVSIPVVYGYRKIAGTVVYAETGSDNNKYLWVAYAMSEGPVEGLFEVWLDNTQLPSTLIPALNRGERVTIAGNDATGNASKFNTLTQLQFWSGTYRNNPADTAVGNTIKNGIFSGAPSFTNTMNYNGCATVFARYEWPTDTTNNPFGGSIPKLEVCMLGRRVASLTVGNQENYNYQQFTSGYAENYSTNPAEIILDYLRNPFYGKGLSNNDIDWDSFRTAAAKHNQSVTFVTGASGPVLRLDYVVNTSQTIFNNCKEMLSNCRSYLPYTNGRYKIIVEDAGNPTDITSGSAPIAATFNRDNIVGEITYTGIDRASKYNSVTVNYVDPGNQWSAQSVTYPETFAARQEFINADGGREYTGEFTFGGITNPGIAQDMARLILMKSRYQDSISLTVTSQAFELEPGDNIYIDANILKFGTDPLLNAIPWRIISIKLNNNYTFSLGCVRNPDFIYPHVRQGEIDYLYALYVPKGATRYYPPEPIGIPVGYKPPTYAPILDNDPNNPPPSAGTGALIDVAELYSIQTLVRTEQAYIQATFNQPNNSSYASTIIRYKQNVASVTTWSQIDITNKPGANQPSTFELGPLVNGTQYLVTTQVKYSTGDVSTRVTPYTVNVSVQLTNTTAPGSGGGTVTVPTAPTPISNTGANYFSYVYSQTVTSGGLPLSTRQVNFVLRQDMSAGENPFLNGVEIFYKPSLNPKWNRSTVSLITRQGSDIAFTLSLGSRLYPLVPGSGGTPAEADNYDFIFRFTYSDGKTSQYQYHATGCSVEYSSGYSFSPLSTGSLLVGGRQLTKDYVPVVVDLSTVTDTRGLTLGIKSISNAINISTQAIYFAINPPSTADFVNWKGVRLYWHQVGTANTWSSTDFTPVNQDVYGYFVGLNILYNVTFEYVIVPLVEYGGTAEANSARYISGTINNTAGYGNWAPYMYVGGLESVADAKARIGTAIASPPVKTTKFASADAETMTTGGFPYPNRQVSFSLKQLVESSPNPAVAGVKIYYKRSSDIYYYEARYPLPVGYTEGDVLNFNSTQTTPAMVLGARNYPAALPPTDAYQTYDFIFRWYYSNEEDGNFELNFTGPGRRSCAIERSQGEYAFHILGATGTTFGTNWTNASSINTAKTAITATTVVNQPPNTVTDVTTLTDTLTAYSFEATVENGSNYMNFWCSSPSANMSTYFKGFRVYYREIILGTNTDFVTNSDNTIYTNSAIDFNGTVATDAVGTKIKNIKWDSEYEFAIIPQVQNGVNIVNATDCFYIRGRFHDRRSETSGLNPFPNIYGNWLTRYRANKVLTDNAMGILSSSPAALTSPPAPNEITAQLFNPTLPLKKYWKLSFLLPLAAGTSFNVYRRSICQPSTPGYNDINLWGLGRWEKITAVVNTDYKISSTGLVTVYLRPAISGLYEFYRYFDAQSDFSTGNRLYENPPGNTEPTLHKLVNDAGTPNANTPGIEATQIMIVFTYFNGTATVESNRAAFFTLQQSGTAAVRYNTNIDFSTATYNSSALDTVISPLPNGIDPSSTADSINAIKRTVIEARSRVADSNIRTGADNAGTYTAPTVTGAVIR